MIDAMALAGEYLYDEETLTRALANYDQDRRRSLRRTQASARTSMAWFEHMDRHTHPETATALAFAMTTAMEATRRGATSCPRRPDTRNP
jgi:hypothetical protein